MCSGYISLVHKETKLQRQKYLPGQTPVARRGETQSQEENEGQNNSRNPTVSEHVINFAREQISGEMTQRLLRLAQCYHDLEFDCICTVVLVWRKRCQEVFPLIQNLAKNSFHNFLVVIWN